MASGKSSVGARLAAELEIQFVDSDREIERESGRTVLDIFEQLGEETFRALEYEVLRKTALFADAVVATGGGAIASLRNRELLARLGTTFWLDLPWPTIYRRLQRAEGDSRPLARDLESAKRLYFERQPKYEEADYRMRIAADDSVGVVAARIRRLAKRHHALSDSF